MIGTGFLQATSGDYWKGGKLMLLFLSLRSDNLSALCEDIGVLGATLSQLAMENHPFRMMIFPAIKPQFIGCFQVLCLTTRG